MKCEKCGNEIREGYVHCQFCNNNLLSDEKNKKHDSYKNIEEVFYNDEKLNNKDEEKADKYVVYYYIGLLVTVFCTQIDLTLSTIGYIYMIIVAVTAKIKYPNNKSIKRIFVFTILSIILNIIFILLIIWSCNAIWEYMIDHCSGCY